MKCSFRNEREIKLTTSKIKIKRDLMKNRRQTNENKKIFLQTQIY